MRERVAHRTEAAADFAGELVRRQRARRVQHTVTRPVVVVEQGPQVLKIHGRLLSCTLRAMVDAADATGPWPRARVVTPCGSRAALRNICNQERENKQGHAARAGCPRLPLARGALEYMQRITGKETATRRSSST